MPFTLAQQTTQAVMPKITGFSTMLFSSLIVYYVVRNKKKRHYTYIIDCSSPPFPFATCHLLFFGSHYRRAWPIIPRDSGLLWTVGNDRTCNVQGFFTQFGISSSFLQCQHLESIIYL
jgi:hypothetical protein